MDWQILGNVVTSIGAIFGLAVFIYMLFDIPKLWKKVCDEDFKEWNG